MATIFEKIYKGIDTLQEKEFKKGYKKGFQDATRLRLGELMRGKPIVEKVKILLKL